MFRTCDQLFFLNGFGYAVDSVIRSIHYARMPLLIYIATHRLPVHCQPCGGATVWLTERQSAMDPACLTDWAAGWSSHLGLHSRCDRAKTSFQHKPLSLRNRGSHCWRYAELCLICCAGCDIFCWSWRQLHPRCNQLLGIPPSNTRLACYVHGGLVGRWLCCDWILCLGLHEQFQLPTKCRCG